MRIIVIADHNGKEIVRRRLKDNESHKDAYREEEEKYYKKLNHGNQF